MRTLFVLASVACTTSPLTDHTDSTSPTDSGADTGTPVPDAFEAPCGMHVLATQDLPNNIREVSWVSGYVVRSRWDLLEPTAGDFDFSALDTVLEQLEPLGQTLTLQMIGSEPEHVVSEATETWRWFDPNPRRSDGCASKEGCVRVLPWDVPSQRRRRALLAALAAHEAPYDGGTVPLASHPLLDGVMISLRGWGRVRELGFQVEAWPDYDRAALVDATVSDIIDQAEAFPDTSVHVQIWPVRDGIDAPTELWEDIQAAIPSSLHGRVGYLQENLAHRVEDEADVFVPSVGATPLIAARDDTWTGLQMLTSFARPTPGQEMQVSGGSPVTAMEWSRETHGATYFEIYVADVDQADTLGWSAELERLAGELCP